MLAHPVLFTDFDFGMWYPSPVSRCDKSATSVHFNWSIVSLTALMRSFCDGPKCMANRRDKRLSVEVKTGCVVK